MLRKRHLCHIGCSVGCFQKNAIRDAPPPDGGGASLQTTPILSYLHFFDLQKVELNRGLTSEHGNNNLNLSTRDINIAHFAFEFFKRSINNFNRIPCFYINIIGRIFHAHTALKIFSLFVLRLPFLILIFVSVGIRISKILSSMSKDSMRCLKFRETFSSYPE